MCFAKRLLLPAVLIFSVASVICLETGQIWFRRARFQSRNSVSFCCPHRVLGRELSEILSAYYLCAKANSPSFSAELIQFAAELSEFSLPKQYSRNSIPPVSSIFRHNGTKSIIHSDYTYTFQKFFGINFQKLHLHFSIFELEM